MKTLTRILFAAACLLPLVSQALTQGEWLAVRYVQAINNAIRFPENREAWTKEAADIEQFVKAAPWVINNPMPDTDLKYLLAQVGIPMPPPVPPSPPCPPPPASRNNRAVIPDGPVQAPRPSWQWAPKQWRR